MLDVKSLATEHKFKLLHFWIELKTSVSSVNLIQELKRKWAGLRYAFLFWETLPYIILKCTHIPNYMSNVVDWDCSWQNLNF